jgi:outer membrane protein
MKNHFKFGTFLPKTALAGLALLLFSLSLQAQPKIAILDLKKIFDGYYKTKQADTQLKERATDSEKLLKGMIDDYQKANEEYKKLIDSANDQAVSVDERDKRKKSAESKLLEIQQIEKDVTAFRRTTQNTLEEHKRRMRDKILGEIREVIDVKAKSGNYALVLDTAAESINQTPIVLYTNGANDLTEEILTQINATAPLGALKSGDVQEKPGTAPAGSEKKELKK